MVWFTYNYRQTIPLKRVDGAVTNYQMLLTVNKTTGSSSGAVCYLQNHALSWTGTVPNDIRFTKADGITELDYWIESSDVNTAQVWIEFDSIGTTDTYFYIYYGNAGSPTTSNGVNTFIFYEPFDNLNAWTAGYGTWTADGVCHQTNEALATPWQYGLCLTSPPSNDNRKVSVNMKIVSTSGSRYVCSCGKWNGSTNLLWSQFRKEATPIIQAVALIANASKTAHNSNFDTGYGAWHRLTTGIDASGNIEIWADGVEQQDFTDTDWDQIWTNIMLGTWNTIADFDDLFVANYVDTEPTWGTWGGEETVAAAGGGASYKLIGGQSV